MFHLFHLGPLTSEGRRLWLVGAIDEFGAFVEPILHRSLETALNRMIDDLGEHDVSLDPALAAFAARRGVPVATRPDDLAEAPAVLAFCAVNAQESLPSGTRIQTFLEACQAYGSVAPWERYGTEEPIQITVTARKGETTREAVVLGAHGEPCGLLLCDRPGTALRCVDALRRGDERTAERIDAITLAFASEPAWALEAVRTAFTLPELPTVFRTRRGQLCPVTETELGTLAVVLEAVTLLCADDTRANHSALAELCIDGEEFRARAVPSGPFRVPSLSAGTFPGPGPLN